MQDSDDWAVGSTMLLACQHMEVVGSTPNESTMRILSAQHPVKVPAAYSAIGSCADCHNNLALLVYLAGRGGRGRYTW
jgi:hypothetical protein